MKGSPGGFIPVLPSGTCERWAVTGHSDMHEQVRTSSGGNVCEVCEMHTNPDVYVCLPFSGVGPRCVNDSKSKSGASASPYLFK